MKKLNILLALVILAGVVAAPASALAKEQIKIAGSTTVAPIVDAFIEAFKDMYSDTDFSTNMTGSGDGAAALEDGTAQIAAMSRFMKASEYKDCVDKGVLPVAHVVAMDGICIVVNPRNPVKELSTEQIRKIYTGEIDNWSDVGGPDRPIVVYTRDSSSGTRGVFDKIVMKEGDTVQKMGEAVQEVGSNSEAKKNVQNNENAVAYVGVGYVDESLKALDVDGIEPTQRNIASGRYPIARPLYMFTDGYPKLGSVIHAFVTFHLTEDGQQIIEEKGYVPLTSY